MPNIDTKKLEAYAQRIYERENQFNNYTLKTIARRIKNIGQLSAYDQEALKNMADITGDMDKITKELARITKMNIEDIEKVYAQVINDSVNTYKPLYDFKGMKFVPITENDYAMKLVRHWSELTAEEMINLSHTKALGFVDNNGNFTQLAGAFQQTIDDAVVAVSAGTSDFNSTMKMTIEQLGGSGVQVWYGSGVHRSLEAMVRQNLLWGAKEAAQSYDDYISEELKLDGFEVDAHSGCRPSHEFMQGKLYSYKGDKVIDGVLYEDGSEALKRLKDYGCLHFKTGVLLGVSEPRYSKEELEKIHKETTEKIEYEGREKTLYEWKQTQRRLEREYRKAQTQSDMFKESGNNIAAKDFHSKAKAIKSTYDDLTDKVPGLYNNSERMRTYFKNANSLTNGGGGGIIEENAFYTKDDPMREAFGSAFESNKEETEKILKSFSDKGVELEFREGVMVYQPSPISGKPGKVVFDKKASFGALKHEERHVLDDEASGWRGFRNFMETETAIKFEVDAYDVEIEMARGLNRLDIVERLEILKENRRRELLGE